MMRILSVSPRQCWPPISGARLREYFLIKALGENTELTHVFFSQAGSPPVTPADLSFCNAVVPVAPPKAYTVGKIAAGLVGPWPLPVVNYTSREMAQALRTIVEREKFDLIHLDSIHMAAYAPMLRRKLGAPVLYDWHNIESEIMRRYSRSVDSPGRKLYAAYTARRLEALERHLLRDAFGHVVCSERESRHLRAIAPGARIAVVENGVDTRFFESCRPQGSARNRIVFVGSMSYHANIEAAVWFAHDVWPAIRTRFPRWRLTIVGSNPAPAVLALKGEPNVEVTGTVQDVRPCYGEAVAAIIPLRVGGGTRLKILEALAAGVPVISTTLGAEGLTVTPGSEILIADTVEAWVRHLAELAPQGELWSSLAERGRLLVRARYDWDALGGTLLRTYSEWLKEAGPAKQRDGGIAPKLQ